MTSYQGNLPSVHFGPDEVPELIEVLTRRTSPISYVTGGDELQIKISVQDGGFSHEYTSAEEMVGDPALPSKILDFEISIEGDEGRISLSAHSTGDTGFGEYTISGDDDWVKTKQTDIEQFFSNHKNRGRTLLNKGRWWTPLSAVISITATSPVYFFVKPSYAFAVTLIAWNFIWFFQVFGLNRVYPYIAINREDETTKLYYGLLYKIIMSVSGLVVASIAIYEFIFG